MSTFLQPNIKVAHYTPKDDWFFDWVPFKRGSDLSAKSFRAAQEGKLEECKKHLNWNDPEALFITACEIAKNLSKKSTPQPSIDTLNYILPKCPPLVDSKGMTPLMYIAQDCPVETFLRVKNREEYYPSITNKNGKTAEEILLSEGKYSKSYQQLSKDPITQKARSLDALIDKLLHDIFSGKHGEPFELELVKTLRDTIKTAKQEGIFSRLPERKPNERCHYYTDLGDALNSSRSNYTNKVLCLALLHLGENTYSNISHQRKRINPDDSTFTRSSKYYGLFVGAVKKNWVEVVEFIAQADPGFKTDDLVLTDEGYRFSTRPNSYPENWLLLNAIRDNNWFFDSAASPLFATERPFHEHHKTSSAFYGCYDGPTVEMQELAQRLTHPRAEALDRLMKEEKEQKRLLGIVEPDIPRPPLIKCKGRLV